MKVKERALQTINFLDAKSLQGKKNRGGEKTPQGQNQFMHALQKRLI
jgi:amidase